MGKAKENKVEVQRGPINMDEQYTYKFRREPESTAQDMFNMSLRRSGQILTKHEPKK